MESFIHQEFLSDTTICKKLIQYHEKDKEKSSGLCYFKGGLDVNREYKDSIDSKINPSRRVFKQYYEQLKIVTSNYIKKFPSCNFYSPWGIIEEGNVQHYRPNGGFKIWHSERVSVKMPTSTRHLVFMTYLNDVTDGGETEFLNQGIKVSPKEGLTLIWPADWTHTHRGIPSPTQDKYIITGWFNYLEREKEDQ
jgi:prolyl 4-hydroxylase